MTNNILFIGASGFVGTRLIGITKDQYPVTNLDKRQSHFFPELTVLGDIRNPSQIEEIFHDKECVVLLAAEHRDDVSPIELYYDVNVQGTKNVVEAMEKANIKKIIFISSVAIYGINKHNPDESFEADPFNHYGKSKWQAEQFLQEWHKTHPDWDINIIRPTVIFGERNRGNVYNLLKQISSGKFLMVGKGNNLKSMAYVGNVVEFIKFLIDNKTYSHGYNVYNYIDKPDITMNALVSHVGEVLDKHIPATHFPLWLGMLGGYGFDFLAYITRKKLAVSSVRVKKFCGTTQFDASKVKSTGFKPSYTLQEGLARTLEFEFVHPRTDDVIFESE